MAAITASLIVKVYDCVCHIWVSIASPILGWILTFQEKVQLRTKDMQSLGLC